MTHELDAKGLAPCPFCGKQPISMWQSAGGDDGYWGIDCCHAFAHEHDEATAISIWNRRAYLGNAEPVEELVRSARLDEREKADWQPIETAPKDGTRILLAKIVGHPGHPTALWWATAGHWSEKWKNWNDGIEPAGLAGPTHWLPMNAHGVGSVSPAPPSGEGIKEAEG